MNVWVIFDHPLDFPNSFVVRKQVIHRGAIYHDPNYILAQSLEEARKYIPVTCLRLPPHPDDDPVIAESWI